MTNINYTSQDDNTQVTLRTVGATKVAETTTAIMLDPSLRKPKKKVDLKKVPNQTDDTPKTKKRYFYEKTGNYVTYARAKQLNLIN